MYRQKYTEENEVENAYGIDQFDEASELKEEAIQIQTRKRVDQRGHFINSTKLRKTKGSSTCDRFRRLSLPTQIDRAICWQGCNTS